MRLKGSDVIVNLFGLSADLKLNSISSIRCAIGNVMAANRKMYAVDPTDCVPISSKGDKWGTNKCLIFVFVYVYLQ